MKATNRLKMSLSVWPTEWEKKEWGRVNHSFQSEQSAVSRLEVLAGTRCSKHIHKQRTNLFFVMSGLLLIQEWDEGCGEQLNVYLPPGGVHIVDSNILHRFCVVKSGRVLEVYWPDADGGRVSIDDIEREDKGGVWREWKEFSDVRSRGPDNYLEGR